MASKGKKTSKSATELGGNERAFTNPFSYVNHSPERSYMTTETCKTGSVSEYRLRMRPSNTYLVGDNAR